MPLSSNFSPRFFVSSIANHVFPVQELAWAFWAFSSLPEPSC